MYKVSLEVLNKITAILDKVNPIYSDKQDVAFIKEREKLYSNSSEMSEFIKDNYTNVR